MNLNEVKMASNNRPKYLEVLLILRKITQKGHLGGQDRLGA